MQKTLDTFFQTRRDWIGQKTISRYCPLNPRVIEIFVCKVDPTFFFWNTIQMIRQNMIRCTCVMLCSLYKIRYREQCLVLYSTLFASLVSCRLLADYTVKKIHEFPVSSRDVTNQTPPGQEYFSYDVIIPAQGEFGSDIPAGDGKLPNLFLRWHDLRWWITFANMRYQRSMMTGDPMDTAMELYTRRPLNNI